MNKHRCFALFAGLTCSLTGLASVLPLRAAPNAAGTTIDTPAVAVVREFLADRAAGKYAAAYALLSARTRHAVTVAQFAAGNAPPKGQITQIPPQTFGIVALFIDTHNTTGCTFTAIGPDPAKPSVVLVQEVRAGTSPVTLRLLTVTDPAAHMPRIDADESIHQAGTADMAAMSPAERGRVMQEASQSNLKHLALAVIEYNQDHDEKMPDAAHWVDALMPYVKDKTFFRDPSAPASQTYSYAYNSALSHQELAVMDAPQSTVMLFESSKGVKNAADTGQSVPLPGRHNGGTDYAFADGTVKWFKDGTKLSYKLDGK